MLAVALTAHLETASAPAIPPLTPNMAGAISCALTARLGPAGLTGRAGMIPRAEECLRKAKEAEAMAEAARDQAAREYTEVAKQWRTLADQVEKRGS